MPLAERLDKLVIVSKQALWETRNYMFSLRPLMSGDSTLSQMLTSQIQEFQTISDLPVQLEIEGSEGAVDGEQYRVSKYAQVGATLFRIVQEALTNAYKHAGATQLWVHLRYLPDSIEVAIRDNGRGLSAAPDGQANGEEPRIYSGHALKSLSKLAVVCRYAYVYQFSLERKVPKLMAKIRLMIVDDHEVVRLGMRAAFELEADIEVVGEASDGEEALAKMGVLDPQVILMDVRMQRMSGIEACREIKSRYPAARIVMITSYSDEQAVFDSIMAGADGYLLKNVSRTELLKALRAVAAGQSLLDPAMSQKAVARMTGMASGHVQAPGEDLTEREREVLALVARGYTNKQIAEVLIVSEKTARNHVSHILEKLGLSRRSEAAAFAVEHKLVPPQKRDA
jgi:two-component system response regulator DevR